MTITNPPLLTSDRRKSYCHWQAVFTNSCELWSWNQTQTRWWFRL